MSKTLPPVIADGIVVSSTAIRDARPRRARRRRARLLGRPYALAGEIRTGTGQGRKLIVPTLNLSTEQEMLPKNGVYATEDGRGKNLSRGHQRRLPPDFRRRATARSNPTSSISARISPAARWKCTSGRACATSRNFRARCVAQAGAQRHRSGEGVFRDPRDRPEVTNRSSCGSRCTDRRFRCGWMLFRSRNHAEYSAFSGPRRAGFRSRALCRSVCTRRECGRAGRGFRSNGDGREGAADRARRSGRGA